MHQPSFQTDGGSFRSGLHTHSSAFPLLDELIQCSPHLPFSSPVFNFSGSERFSERTKRRVRRAGWAAIVCRQLSDRAEFRTPWSLCSCHSQRDTGVQGGGRGEGSTPGNKNNIKGHNSWRAPRPGRCAEDDFGCPSVSPHGEMLLLPITRSWSLPLSSGSSGLFVRFRLCLSQTDWLSWGARGTHTIDRKQPMLPVNMETVIGFTTHLPPPPSQSQWAVISYPRERSAAAPN